MRANPLNELFRLTRAELLALYAEIAAELASVPEMSTDREIALNNLRDIRRVLALKPRGPGPR